MKLLTIIFLFSILTISCSNHNKNINTPKAQKGILDLRNWNFEKNGPVDLNGEWEFYWKKLLTPSNFYHAEIKNDGYYKVPTLWNEKIFNDKKLDGEGFATFRLKILSNKNLRLEIAIDELMTSYKCWSDSVEIFECGKVSNKSETNLPRQYPVMKNIDIKTDTTVLIFQIANFHHRVGGFFTSPKIGTNESLSGERIKKISFDLFLFGSILIMSFYHFGFFYLRREKSAAFFFAVFTLILSIRTLFTGSQFITVIFPDINWFLKYRIEYLTLYISPIFIIYFLYKIYKKDINERITQIFAIISLLFAFTIILPPVVFTRLLIFYQLILVFTIIYIFTRLIKTIILKRLGARILFSSVLVFFFTIINDILFTRGLIPNSIELVPFGTFIFILGQSLVLARIFTGAFYEKEALTLELDYQNKNLENIVEQRTSEVEKQKLSILEINEELTLQNEEIQSINESLEEQKKKLVESEEKFRSLVELLPEAIFEMDNQGKLIYANDEFYRKLGYEQTDIQKGLNCSEIVIYSNSETEQTFVEQINLQYSTNKVLKELEYRLLRRDKSSFPVLLSLSPVSINENIAYRCVFVDITQRVENEQKIKVALKDIRKKNKDITDSIEYALHIQNAVLPSGDLIASLFEDFFIINKPHTIVSGDFYYFSKKGDKIVFAISDCTGHGVPGGFMTMLGITQLNEIYNHDEFCSTEKALGIMRKQVIESLNQNITEYGSKDGMDMLLCILDTKTLKLEFSSANQSFYLMRNGNLTLYRGDKMPVGIYRRMNPYTNYEIQLQRGDILYMFTDGIVDLFGGENDRRLYIKGLQEIILKVYTEKLSTQCKLIENLLYGWQGKNKQTDDMLMIGLRI